jgi:hypothetical protein
MMVRENQKMELIVYQNLVFRSVRIHRMDYTIEDKQIANNCFQNYYLAFNIRMFNLLME